MSALSQPESRAVGWRDVVAEMLEGARDAVLRFPVTVAVLVLLAACANLLIVDDQAFGERGDYFLLALFVASGASLAATLFCERHALSRPTSAAAAMVAALLAFGAVWWDKSLGVYPQAFLAAVAALVLVAPYLGRGDGASFWMFSVRFAFAALLAGLALLLFAGGISAILASLTYLFGLSVPNEAYGHVWATTGLLAAPLFGLGQIPRDFDVRPDSTAADFMERGMRALGDFVAAPLLLVYALILHLYALKILITGAVPQGQIGWLVLAFGICVIGSLIVIHPFLSAARAPTRLFLRLWPFTLPVPLALLLYAAALRIGDHGVTPDRYLLTLFGLTAVAILVLQVPRSTRGDIRIMAALPAIALLLASFGPQGAMKTSIRSQTARFEALVAAGPMEGGRHDQALSALRFLLWNGAVARVAPDEVALAGADGKPKTDQVLFEEIAAAYGINPNLELGPNATFNRSFAQPAAFSVAAGFDIVIPMIGIYEGQGVAMTLPSGLSLNLRMENGALVASGPGIVVRFPVSAERVRQIASTPAERSAPEMPQTPPEPLVLESGSRQIVVLPSHLFGELQPQPRLRSMTGALLLRSADWRQSN